MFVARSHSARSLRQGFTLVELSMVLVIIGILIGGVLIAQSMAETAKTQAFIRRIQQFDIAITNFRSKYSAIPGDSVAFGCTSGHCGDGILQDSRSCPSSDCPGSVNGYPYTTKVWGGSNGAEWENFWVQLQVSGFTFNGATFVNDPIDTNGLFIHGKTINAPAAEMTNSNVGIMPISIGGEFTELGPYKLYYMVCELGNDLPGAPNIYCGGGPDSRGVAPVFAVAVDKKIDDGKPQSGIMWSYNGLDGTCSLSGNYYFQGYSANSRNCYVYIKVGIENN